MYLLIILGVFTDIKHKKTKKKTKAKTNPYHSGASKSNHFAISFQKAKIDKIE